MISRLFILSSIPIMWSSRPLSGDEDEPHALNVDEPEREGKADAGVKLSVNATLNAEELYLQHSFKGNCQSDCKVFGIGCKFDPQRSLELTVQKSDNQVPTTESDKENYFCDHSCKVKGSGCIGKYEKETASFPNQVCGELSNLMFDELQKPNPAATWKVLQPQVDAYLADMEGKISSKASDAEKKQKEADGACAQAEKAKQAKTASQGNMTADDVRKIMADIFSKSKPISTVEAAQKEKCGEDGQAEMAAAFDQFMEEDDIKGLGLVLPPNKVITDDEMVKVSCEQALGVAKVEGECDCSICQDFCDLLSVKMSGLYEEGVGATAKGKNEAKEKAKDDEAKEKECAKLIEAHANLIVELEEMQDDAQACNDFSVDINGFLAELGAIFKRKEEAASAKRKQGVVARKAGKALDQAKESTKETEGKLQAASATMTSSCATSKDIEVFFKQGEAQRDKMQTSLASLIAELDEARSKNAKAAKVYDAAHGLKIAVAKVVLQLYNLHATHGESTRLQIEAALPAPQEKDIAPVKESLKGLTSACGEEAREAFASVSTVASTKSVDSTAKAAKGKSAFDVLKSKPLGKVVTASIAADYCDTKFAMQGEESITKDIQAGLVEQLDCVKTKTLECLPKAEVLKGESVSIPASDEIPHISETLGFFGTGFSKSAFGNYLQNWKLEGKFMTAMQSFDATQQQAQSSMTALQERVTADTATVANYITEVTQLGKAARAALEVCETDKGKLAEAQRTLDEAIKVQEQSAEAHKTALAEADKLCKEVKDAEGQLQTKKALATMKSFLQLLANIGALEN